MNKIKYPNTSEREKALDFKIPEEAVFERMEDQFNQCDKMLKGIKLQIAEKEKKNQLDNLEKIEEVK